MNHAIEVKNVTKIYRLYEKPIDRLKEALSFSGKNLHRDFYALRGVSFHVKKGESLGIIGVNGSGKSTILKIITGVLTPTKGEVVTEGKISALLELGAGFNMDYTGIENVYMNGTMMGFSRKEMDEKLPEILSFADIGDFVHQPVKSYSSGMFVRLAFALAINVEPEILIVDEALSVGDVFFQAKCYHRMDELRKNGTTILMVTHDMSSVLKYCDRTVILHKGEKVAEGRPGEMVDLYKKILAGQFNVLRDMLESRRQAEAEATEKTKKETSEETSEETGEETGEATGEATSKATSEATGKATGEATGAFAMDGAESTDGSGTSGAGETVGATKAAWGAKVGLLEKTGQAAGTGGEQGKEEMPLMRCSMNINPNVNEYGNGKAEIYDYGIIDAQGKISSLVLKGETFTLKEKIRFYDRIEAPIFTFTIRDKKGTDLTGTNTMFENIPIESVKKGDSYEVSFTQAMDLQGGEYLISMSCTGFEQGMHTVYHRLYDLIDLTVISNKNTVGVYDTNSVVKAEKHAGSAENHV